MVEILTVPDDEKMRDVPVLTVNHLRVLRSVEMGASMADLAADDRTSRFVKDLYQLGWVKQDASLRH
ncbi:MULTISPECIES: hypothetical protein [Brevibacillus]|uniref:hypothetical protein n=1 Tax=Brevibacillus TaxID=55080 RepID=UPI00111448BD|nr:MULTISPECIES: hypothetical protein [Brevibacillus]MDR7317044.1 hypothetical protein [Brevibacillus nitrificans]MEC2129942.1 hypothetical protein [Brevibacillus centrosporus]MED1952842.1 hypothetical protein [Brevibacillus centrosporus]MED4907240.1 hypothetical protein [Brevibacillus centrosporus]GED32476.1 hypothetical protein BCE02nite_36170 [Brevibacillus centrosporus]